MDKFNYTENQRFTNNALLLIPVGLTAALLLKSQVQAHLGLTVAILAGGFLVALVVARSLKMNLVFSEKGLQADIWAVLHESTLIPWGEVTECSFVQRSRWSFAGYGIRWSLRGRAYIVEGKHILKVVFGGNTLFLTVKNREAVEQVLQHFLPNQQSTINN